jgi:hypothetical protein
VGPTISYGRSTRLAVRRGIEPLTRAGREAGLIANVAGIVCVVAWGCAPSQVGRRVPAPCGALDSLYASSGFEEPVSIVGQATVDANQYKVRGKIHLDALSPGELSLEFTSTVLFGHAREDIVFSSVGDTLRILDRERGAYYEGGDAESFIAESLETDLDVRAVLSLVLGGHPPCDELSDVRFDTASSGALICTGAHRGGRFRVVFGGGRRLEEVEWPVRSETYGSDRLRVTYEWALVANGKTALRGMVVNLEKREWRCKVKTTT